VEVLRCLVVRSSQLAQQAATTYTAAQAKEAERVAAHIQCVAARWCACAADAEAAIIDYEGRGQGRWGRKPRLWRSHALRYRIEIRQVYGVQDSHLRVCDALGLDHTWYEGADSAYTERTSYTP
jgi:hypothetical protein